MSQSEKELCCTSLSEMRESVCDPVLHAFAWRTESADCPPGATGRDGDARRDPRCPPRGRPADGAWF